MFDHPSIEDLALYADGLLDSRRKKQIETHLDVCEDCALQVLVSREVRDVSAAGLAPAMTTAHRDADKRLLDRLTRELPVKTSSASKSPGPGKTIIGSAAVGMGLGGLMELISRSLTPQPLVGASDPAVHTDPAAGDTGHEIHHHNGADSDAHSTAQHGHDELSDFLEDAKKVLDADDSQASARSENSHHSKPDVHGHSSETHLPDMGVPHVPQGGADHAGVDHSADVSHVHETSHGDHPMGVDGNVKDGGEHSAEHDGHAGMDHSVDIEQDLDTIDDHP